MMFLLPLVAAQQSDLQMMTQQITQQMKLYHKKIGTKPWNWETAVKDLPCQVGSLTKLVMQLKRERKTHGLSNYEIKIKMADELADILSLVLFIAHELNIDMKEAWNSMLQSDAKKMEERSS